MLKREERKSEIKRLKEKNNETIAIDEERKKTLSVGFVFFKYIYFVKNPSGKKNVCELHEKKKKNSVRLPPVFVYQQQQQ
jgi:hypothetical protein